MNRPMFFQLPSSSPEKLADFYVNVFGWSKGRMAEMGDIWALVTGPFDKPGINGTILGKMMECTVNGIEVADLDESIKKVMEFGGKIITPRHHIDKMGDFAWCTDNDDNPFVLAQLDQQYIPTILHAVGGIVPDTEGPNRPVHFEIPATDPVKTAQFYVDALGWKMQKFDGPFEYYLMSTGDENSAGINGAIMRKGENKYPVNTISINDIDVTLEKVLKHGGKVLMPKDEIPGVGLFAYVLDPEGNQIGLMQPNPM